MDDKFMKYNNVIKELLSYQNFGLKSFDTEKCIGILGFKIKSLGTKSL